MFDKPLILPSDVQALATAARAQRRRFSMLGGTKCRYWRRMSQPLELYRHYRTEVQHEMGLMLARLNALLTSQSFLVIAYAFSMAIANGHWS
jgi:hypothetical protein